MPSHTRIHSLQIGNYANDELLLESMRYTERFGEPFRAVINVVSEEHELNTEEMLGFRGLYEDSDLAEPIIQAHGFPATLDRWTQQAVLSIQLGDGRPPMNAKKRELRGAPVRVSRGVAIWPWFGVVVLGSVATLYYFANSYSWN